MGFIINEGSVYTNEVFESADFEQTEFISNEFHDCSFTKCSFPGTIFIRCRFVSCAFLQCDLSLVQIGESSFSDIRFEESKIVGVNWTKADWGRMKFSKPPSFLRCDISHSTFIGLALGGLELKESKAINVDFRDTNLEKANFEGTDFAESLFGKTNLRKADLSEAINYYIVPEENDLKGAKFSLPEAMSLLYNLDIDLVERDTQMG